MRKDNKGFSFIEMLVSVTILSIIMLAIGWILSTMSKNFADTQREVELQNSVQTTYSVVSELIMESQVIDSENNNKTVAVKKDGTTSVTASANKAVITVEDPLVSLNSKEYTVVLVKAAGADTGNLYLYEKADLTAYNADKSPYLLSKNVKTFKVDTTPIASGYVILEIELKYGSRTAQMKQNVYLRNSNKSNLIKDTGTTDTPTPTPTGAVTVTAAPTSEPEVFYVDPSQLSDDPMVNTDGYEVYSQKNAALNVNYRIGDKSNTPQSITKTETTYPTGWFCTHSNGATASPVTVSAAGACGTEGCSQRYWGTNYTLQANGKWKCDMCGTEVDFPSTSVNYSACNCAGCVNQYGASNKALYKNYDGSAVTTTKTLTGYVYDGTLYITNLGSKPFKNVYVTVYLDGEGSATFQYVSGTNYMTDDTNYSAQPLLAAQARPTIRQNGRYVQIFIPYLACNSAASDTNVRALSYDQYPSYKFSYKALTTASYGPALDVYSVKYDNVATP